MHTYEIVILNFCCAQFSSIYHHPHLPNSQFSSKSLSSVSSDFILLLKNCLFPSSSSLDLNTMPEVFSFLYSTKKRANKKEEQARFPVNFDDVFSQISDDLPLAFLQLLLLSRMTTFL